MSYFPALRHDDGEVNILLVSTIVFGIVAFAFSLTSIFAVIDSQNSKRSLTSATKTAYTNGQAAQKVVDDKDHLLANESPYRSYKAGSEFGSFVINFPKNWNAWVTEDVNATNQVNLVIHPDLVKVKGTSNLAGNAYAFRALLIKQASTALATQLDARVKGKKMTSKPVTVAGITATQYTGAWDDQHNGVLVLVPVRDKSMEFITDYPKDYINEFNQILAQAVIVK